MRIAAYPDIRTCVRASVCMCVCVHMFAPSAMMMMMMMMMILACDWSTLTIYSISFVK